MPNVKSLFYKLLISFVLPPFVVFFPAVLGVYDAFLVLVGSAIFLLISLLVASGLGFLIAYILVFRNIQNLSAFINTSERREGDLTRRLPVSGQDEISIIARSQNVFISQIHQIIFTLKNIVMSSTLIGRELAEKILEVGVAIEEISDNSYGIAQQEKKLNTLIFSSRTHINDIRNAIDNIVEQIASQAVSVDESSAAVEETIASIQNLNRLSESKTGLVANLNSLAAEGENNMKLTLVSMKGIASSVDMVKSLIKVINDVAAKTNLLAMNAAIEAAHAGEHGRGFSVVADEIRKLAEKTAKNAGEINQNLVSMVKGIESSQNLTEKTDHSIKELVGGIKNVADSLTEIMAGLSEMSSGTREITNSLTSLIDITEEVKENSKLIDDKSTQIDVVMSAVIEISEETMKSMKGFTTSVEGIKTASQDISQAGKENAENIDIVNQEVSRFKIIDTSGLKSSDGQDLIQWNKKKKEIPKRSANPHALPESDMGYWYDLEYAGWNTKKENMPASYADGAKGKTVILLESCDHPYHTAYKTGCKKLADAFGVQLKSYNADYSPDKQAKQVELAIRDKPDLIIVTPTSVEKSTGWFKAINGQGIPVIGSNTTPNDEGFKYIVGWSGPDDWGQFRLLAHEFAKQMDFMGGYGIIRHAVGNSNYFSRTFSILTELKKIAPQMQCLVMESALKEEETLALVQKWTQKYGEKLKGLCFSDPANGARGMCKAVKDAGRSDMVLVSSGNSTVTQDLVKNGQIHAITYQSAEADGALAMEMAIDWFNGILLEPIRYLPMQIITKDNVEKFYPSQW